MSDTSNSPTGESTTEPSGTADTAGTGGSSESTDTTDWKAESEKWKAQARKHEERAKANAKAAADLSTLQQQSMTDQEKAVAKAREEGRLEAVKDASARLVAAEVKAAAKGRLPDDKVKTLLAGLNLAAFVKDDGEIDEAGIAKWVESVTPTSSGFPDLGQGARGTTGNNGDMNALIRQAAGRT